MNNDLFDKFPDLKNARPQDPQRNTTVQTVLAAEQITAGTYGPDNSPLFDPTWSPAMWERAKMATRELRTAIAEDRIHYDSHDYDVLDGKFDIENPPGDAVFIWFVGSGTVLVCCRAGATETDRRLRGPDYFSGMLRFFAEIDDYHRYSAGADCELRCTINIAEHCTAQAPDFSGGTTRLMPLQRGQFILLWRVCRACEAKACETVETIFRTNVMAAQAELPPGARIDPGSPVSPTP
jgi:hypothetical protein